MLETVLLSVCAFCQPGDPAAAVPWMGSAAHVQQERAKKHDPKTEKEKKADKTEKPPVYPELSVLHKQKIKRLFISLKNRNPKKRKAYEKDMIAIGRGAIPSLIDNGTTKHEGQGECVFNCLMALMDKRDAVTLNECYKSKERLLRLLAVLKIGTLKNEKFLNFLKDALKDGDPEIRLEAALGLVSLKCPVGIKEIILKRAENHNKKMPRLTETLPMLKHKAYTSLFTPYLVKHEDPKVRIVTAEVIADINDKGLKSTLGMALNDSHNLVQTAAVNALRKLVNGEEPRKFNNVFELVEIVNKWKKELGIIR